MFDMLDDLNETMLSTPTGCSYAVKILLDLPNLYDLKTAEQLTDGDKKRIRYFSSDLNRTIDKLQRNDGLLKTLSDKGYPYAQELYIKILDLKKQLPAKRKYMLMLSKNPYTVNGIRAHMRAELEKMGIQTPASPAAPKPALKGATFSALKYEESKPRTNRQILQRQFENNGERLMDLNNLDKAVHLSPYLIETITDIQSDFNRYLKTTPIETRQALAQKGYPYAQFLTAAVELQNRHFKTAQEWLETCLKNPLTRTDLQDLALDTMNKMNHDPSNGHAKGSTQNGR